jgi:hypothetical protein
VDVQRAGNDRRCGVRRRDFRVRVPKAAVPECTTAELRVHFTDPVWLVQELLLDRGLHDR